jgi:hypothetical protein
MSTLIHKCFVSTVLLGQMGKPDELAKAVGFLGRTIALYYWCRVVCRWWFAQVWSGMARQCPSPLPTISRT